MESGHVATSRAIAPHALSLTVSLLDFESSTSVGTTSIKRLIVELGLVRSVTGKVCIRRIIRAHGFCKYTDTIAGVAAYLLVIVGKTTDTCASALVRKRRRCAAKAVDDARERADGHCPFVAGAAACGKLANQRPIFVHHGQKLHATTG